MLFENFVSGSERNSYNNISMPPTTVNTIIITYNVITFHAVRFTPRTHHKRIIVGNYRNNVDSLCLDLGQVFNVGREVVDRACRREGTCLVINTSSIPWGYY